MGGGHKGPMETLCPPPPSPPPPPPPPPLGNLSHCMHPPPPPPPKKNFSDLLLTPSLGTYGNDRNTLFCSLRDLCCSHSEVTRRWSRCHQQQLPVRLRVYRSVVHTAGVCEACANWSLSFVFHLYLFTYLMRKITYMYM